MSMVFEKHTEVRGDGSTYYTITRIDGVNPRSCLPKEYLNKGNRIFRIESKHGNKGVVILSDMEDFETSMIKIFPGKTFKDSEWKSILGLIKDSGNRLHDIRKAQRIDNQHCTDIV